MREHRTTVSPYLFYGGAFALTALVILLLTGYTPLSPAGAILTGINTAAFIVFGFDKGIARYSTMRVPEKVIYGMAALGGSLGVLIGMTFFRHKIRKGSFQLAIGSILMIQLLIFSFLQMHYGLIFFRR